VGHLADLGHRRVVLLTASLPSTPGRPAQLLAVRVARDLGMELTAVAAPAAMYEAAGVATELLSGPDRPGAIFCLSDSLAFGVYQAARLLSLRIPEDVSVLGFDDHQLAALVSPGLTTLSWDEQAIVAAALAQLDAVMDGDTPDEPVIFRPELIVRGSTRSPPGPTPSSAAP